MPSAYRNPAYNTARAINPRRGVCVCACACSVRVHHPFRGGSGGVLCSLARARQRQARRRGSHKKIGLATAGIPPAPPSWRSVNPARATHLPAVVVSTRITARSTREEGERPRLTRRGAANATARCGVGLEKEARPAHVRCVRIAHCSSVIRLAVLYVLPLYKAVLRMRRVSNYWEQVRRFRFALLVAGIWHC